MSSFTGNGAAGTGIGDVSGVPPADRSRRLGEMATAWRGLLKTPDSIVAAVREKQLARRLHAAVLDRIEQEGLLRSPQVRRLRLIADGPLGTIPFAALLDSGQRRLIERFALTHPFPHLPPVAQPARPRLAALSVAAPRNALAPPHFARAEAHQIAALFPETLRLVAGAATRRAVRDAMPRARILHLATHALSDSRNGLRSALFLAPDASGDRRLEAGDLLSLSLSARLAVLSACETALGQAAGGDCVISLPWALRAAGCASTVASLWAVEDASAIALMARFYVGLRQGLARDVALQRAMRSLQVEPRWRRPLHWAAFQLVGDNAPLT